MGSEHYSEFSPCLTDAEDRARLAALPVSHFEPLFALLPRLDRVKSEREEDEDGKDGSYTWVFVPSKACPVALDFTTLCYRLHLVLRWGNWPAFMQAHPFWDRPAMIDQFDRYQCCMAITTIIRGDRFGDGTTEGYCRGGTVARIIRRLQGGAV